MTRPSRVTVGPFVVRIIGGDPAVGMLDAGDAGCYDHLRGTIAVRDGLAPLPEREVVVHETLHVATEVAGLRDELGDEKEEAVVRRLAPVVLDILRRNPRLVEYLVG